MEALTALRLSRDLLAHSGWVRGAFGVGPGGRILHQDNFHEAESFCALGALYAVQGIPTRITEAERYLNKAVEAHYGENIGLLMFNDRLAKDKDEVLRVYDIAIMLADLDRETRHAAMVGRLNAAAVVPACAVV